jgi:hypothetical protein
MSSMQISKFQPRIRGERRGRKPRGRPRVDSDLNIPMRINNELRGIIESENRHNETHNDRLLRIIRERSTENQKLRERIRQLEEKIRLKFEIMKLRSPLIRMQYQNKIDSRIDSFGSRSTANCSVADKK